MQEHQKHKAFWNGDCFETSTLIVSKLGHLARTGTRSVRITDIAVPNWPYRIRTDKLAPGARSNRLKLKWFSFVSAWPVALIINDRALCRRGNFILPAPQKRKLMFCAVPKIAHHITRFFITLSLEWIWVMIARMIYDQYERRFQWNRHGVTIKRKSLRFQLPIKEDR